MKALWRVASRLSKSKFEVGASQSRAGRVMAAAREDDPGPMQAEMETLMNDVRVTTLLATAVRGLMNQADPLMPVAAVRAPCAANPALSWHELPDPNHYSITLGAGAVPLAADIAAFSAQHSSIA